METTAKQRLENERDELIEKLEKLDAFKTSEKIKELSDEAQTLLYIQADIMSAYVQVLTRRIDIWED